MIQLPQSLPRHRHGAASTAGPCVQDLQAVAEENAILMRECAMASLSSAPPAPAEGAHDGPLPTMHPEMLEESPRSIPDTAKDFIFYANETPMERFERERDWRQSDEAEGGSSAGTHSDEPRPGVLLGAWQGCRFDAWSCTGRALGILTRILVTSGKAYGFAKSCGRFQLLLTRRRAARHDRACVVLTAT